MKISDLYVVEWSELHRTFHIATVPEMLKINLEVFLSERDITESDWLVLAVETSYDAAAAKQNELKKLLDAAPPEL
jgi:hypothetical protein